MNLIFMQNTVSASQPAFKWSPAHWRTARFSERTGYFTPRSTVPLEKLVFSHLIMEFPTIYGTRRLITVFTRTRPASFL
jgi:hypothetical protein